MSSEKYSLKWNDFQSTVSQSLGLLRKEGDFLDVTLVSDEQEQISAHKVVLSACSSFFRNVLSKNPHSHPLLYLGGVSYSNIKHILDYIYHGEAQIYQEQLEGFLQAAERLKVTGLITEEIQRQFDTQISESKPDINQDDRNEAIEIVTHYYDESTVKGVDVDGNTDLNDRIKEMIEKVDGGFICTACGKVSKDIRNHRRHVETHIEGLSYSCQFCDKVFRTSHTLTMHKSRNHK